MSPKNNSSNKYNDIFSSSIEGESIKVNNFSKKKIFKIKKGDIVHFHWVSFFYQHNNVFIMLIRTTIFLLFLLFLKSKKIKIIWTVHNLYPHKYKKKNLEKVIRSIIMLMCNKIIVAAFSIKNEVIREFSVNPQKIEVVPHGHYKGFYPIKKENFREKYNISSDNFVLLFVGAIKKYKGIPELLNVYSRLNNKKINLIIAGKVYDELDGFLKKYKTRKNIIIDNRFIPDDELADLILSCDYVVLPYTSITTSGTAILAVSLRKKIICPKTPFMDEYFDDSTSVKYNRLDNNGLYNALKWSFINRQYKDINDNSYNKFLEKLSWSSIAKKIKAIYLSL